MPGSRRLAVVVAATVAWSCASAPPRLALPAGAGTPAADAVPWLERATAACAGLTSLTAEIALRGRIGPRRVRARLLAGTEASGRVRLEALAPFGAPLFVLVASAETATLLLTRDERVVSGHPLEELLDALAGLRLTGADLHAALGGCGLAPRTARDGRAYGERWRGVDVDPSARFWLSDDAGAPRLVGVTLPTLSIEYGEVTAGWPQRVRLVTPRAVDPASAVDVTLGLSQVERNPAIPSDAFHLDVPAGALPMTLDELRREGRLGS